MWTPSSDTRLAGDTAIVAYGGATPWDAGAQRAPYPSAVALKSTIVRYWLGVTTGGVSRPSSALPAAPADPHRDGFGVDFSVRAGPQRSTVGSSLASLLVTHAESLQVQAVVWDGLSWDCRGSGTRWETYSGADPHDTHVHCELSPLGRTLSADTMAARAREAIRQWGGVGLLTSPTTYLPLLAIGLGGGVALYAATR